MIFNPGKKAAALQEVELPCGKCIGCKLEKSRQWALRMMHEASLYEVNSFITLTYDPEYLPSPPSLDKREWQLFLKKLRKKIYPHKVRFYMCGEYGVNNDLSQLSNIGRPHYHAILFGYDFPDKVVYSRNPNGDYIYTSPLLESVWGKGFVTIGDVTFESAAYCARYVTKKITGEAASDWYQYLDIDTGEVHLLEPEFALMSRRPGIAKDWYDKFKCDLEKGFITSRGIKMQPPKYYDKLLENDAEENYNFLLDELKDSRVIAQMDNAHDNTPDRLAVKEGIKARKLDQLKRKL